VSTVYNPLNKYPKIREYLYGVWWAASGVVGGFGVYYAATPGQIPAEYNVAVLIVSFAGVYLGFTAQRNVTGTDTQGLPVAPPKEATPDE
jgi:ABC-type thiamin/hydroxymethylpyrimidine transport system permease subunit